MSEYSACFTVCHLYLIYGSILSYLFASHRNMYPHMLHTFKYSTTNSDIQHPAFMSRDEVFFLACDFLKQHLYSINSVQSIQNIHASNKKCYVMPFFSLTVIIILKKKKEITPNLKILCLLIFCDTLKFFSQ